MDSYQIYQALKDEVRCVPLAQVQAIDALAQEKGLSWQRIFRDALRKGLQRLRAEERFKRRRVAAFRAATGRSTSDA